MGNNSTLVQIYGLINFLLAVLLRESNYRTQLVLATFNCKSKNCDSQSTFKLEAFKLYNYFLNGSNGWFWHNYTQPHLAIGHTNIETWQNSTSSHLYKWPNSVRNIAMLTNHVEVLFARLKWRGFVLVMIYSLGLSLLPALRESGHKPNQALLTLLTNANVTNTSHFPLI